MMEPEGVNFSDISIQLTDSHNVALATIDMARMGEITDLGDRVWDKLGDSDQFNKGIHIGGD